MQEKIERLQALLPHKKSKSYYAEKLNTTIEDIENLLIKLKNKQPKIKARILLLDIETTPLMAYVWQTQVWKARVGYQHLISNWFMLTWSAKWLGEEDIFSDRLTGEEAISEDDSRLVSTLWLLLDEADVVIAHNGNIFDIPNIQTRCVLHSLPPPSPYKQIDTLRIAQQQFGFTHNSLNALADFFGIGQKIETDFELWKRCIHGEEQALFDMEEYNRHDVVLLEEVFLKIRPYIRNIPNLNVYEDDGINRCSRCGSEDIHLVEDRFYYTQTSKYPLYKCESCGGHSRGTSPIKREIKIGINSIPGR